MNRECPSCRNRRRRRSWNPCSKGTTPRWCSRATTARLSSATAFRRCFAVTAWHGSLLLPACRGKLAVARRARGASANAPSTSPAAPVVGRRGVFRPPRPKPMNSSGPTATAVPRTASAGPPGNRSIRPCGSASPPRPNVIGKRSSASAKTSSVWKTKTINAKCNVRPCFEHSSNSTC